MMTYMTSDEASRLMYVDVSSRLQTNLHHGLTEEEVIQRRKAHGHNDFDISEDEPLWRKYLGQVRVTIP